MARFRFMNVYIAPTPTQSIIQPSTITRMTVPEITPDDSYCAESCDAACAAAITGRKSVAVEVAVAVAEPLGEVVSDTLIVTLPEDVIELVAVLLAEPLGEAVALVVVVLLAVQDGGEDALTETEVEGDPEMELEDEGDTVGFPERLLDGLTVLLLVTD